jgi:enolase
MSVIIRITGRKIIDSQGNLTVKVDVRQDTRMEPDP